MAETRDRVIIDTNLWISYLLSSSFTSLDSLLADNSIALLFSVELLEEFIEVARRPKFRKYFSLTDLQDLLNALSLRIELHAVTTKVDARRDTKDNFLLALAKEGNATHLITGDKDLLDLKEYGQTKILTISAYLSNE